MLVDVEVEELLEDELLLDDDDEELLDEELLTVVRIELV